MADPEKGASTVDSKKQGPSVDEDFGEDFLTSWKSSKTRNDEIDFGMETVPKTKKKSFDFGKIDDFELSGDFDKKLSSFQMDMPDLDFSIPAKKTEKPKEKSSKELVPGKQESKQKFSFNFDFNELDRFVLDSSPRKSERNPGKLTDGTPDQSFKPSGKQISTNNTVTSSDLFKDQETEKSQGTDGMVTSRRDNLNVPSNSKCSNMSTDLGNDAASCDEQTSAMKQNTISVSEEKKSENSGSERREQSKETGLTKPYVEEATQGFLLHTVSGESSAQEDNSQIREESASLNAVKMNLAREQDNSIKSAGSSHSRSTSPANSFDSRSCQKTVELSDARGDIKKCHQGISNEMNGGKQALSELDAGQKNVGKASIFSQNIAFRKKNADDKQDFGLKHIPSLLQRDSTTVNPKPFTTAAQRFKSVNRLAKIPISASSAFVQKQLDYVHDSKVKATNICTGNEDREPKEDQKQAENEKVSTLKSYEEDATKGLKVISGSETIHMSSDTSRLQLITSLPQQTIKSNTAKSSIPNLVSSIPSVRNSKIGPVEMSGTSSKDEKACNISRLSIPRITKLNSKPQSSAAFREEKSVRFCEKALEFPLSAASSMASHIVKEKSAPLNTSLKRKKYEESTPYQDTIKPLKRVMESPTGRKHLEIFSKFQREMVTKASVTEVAETCHSDSSARYLTSNGAPNFRTLMDIEVPKDGKERDISRLTISSQSPSSATPTEAKAEAITDPKTTSPFKRVKESDTRRKSFEISPRIRNTMVPSTDNREACHSENFAEDISSHGIPDQMGSLTHVEIPTFIERDENVEKAETWTKELDDMCSMLRKQHEEAKELLVRAVVTNNQLLMLNHPILEEKINALQKFANSLCFKEF